MSQQHATQRHQAADDEIDLRELFAVIWRGKWIIIATTFVFAVASVIYALSLPDIYKSEALLAPASEQKMGGMSGQLGGLAALAGVNLGNSGAVDKTVLAIEIIKSREFFTRFADKHNIIADLMAVKHWEPKTDKVFYDETIYDSHNNKWVREVSFPKTAKPSFQEAHAIFLSSLSVLQDPTNGMVRLSIEHQSPSVAFNWVNWLVEDINAEMKARDLEESNLSIKYLQREIGQTNVSDVRAALYSLIEEQTKTLMLANVREEYAFKVVDKAVIAEQKAKPARALICIAVTVFGFLLSLFFTLAISIIKK